MNFLIVQIIVLWFIKEWDMKQMSLILTTKIISIIDKKCRMDNQLFYILLLGLLAFGYCQEL